MNEIQVKQWIAEALKPYFALNGANRIEIPSGTDLNDYKTAGNTYVCMNNGIAATLINAPFGGNAFVMTIDPAIVGTQYTMQTARHWTTGQVAARIYNTVNSSWSNWALH